MDMKHIRISEKTRKRPPRITKSEKRWLQYYFDLILFVLVYIRNSENMKRVYYYARRIQELDYRSYSGDGEDQIVRSIRLEPVLKDPNRSNK